MHMRCDPDDDGAPHKGSLGWGFAPITWQNDVGNVLIARADRKPLDLETAEAFADLCFNKLQPTFENALEEGYSSPKKGKRARRAVVDSITPARWQKFLADEGREWLKA